ncbi:conserved hypothetical protein [Ricinus communis]|uniref:Uncharacterized protein n=1 Tax=Ricinus communis TaxID=3988 RepID=B9R9S9_RICCO|nr:conserved hypothetical protein [Ricinus communis]
MRDQGENSQPLNQLRWPERSKGRNLSLNERDPSVCRNSDRSVGGGERMTMGFGLMIAAVYDG